MRIEIIEYGIIATNTSPRSITNIAVFPTKANIINIHSMMNTITKKDKNCFNHTLAKLRDFQLYLSCRDALKSFTDSTVPLLPLFILFRLNHASPFYW